MRYIQGYITCAENNLAGCLAKMQNQYGFISKDTNWNDYNNSQDARARYDTMWPRSIGAACTTNIEQCEETGKWLMNVELTQWHVDALVSVPTTPVFEFSYAGELDEDGEEVPAPTFKRKTPAPEGEVWDGTYFDVIICRQQ